MFSEDRTLITASLSCYNKYTQEYRGLNRTKGDSNSLNCLEHILPQIFGNIWSTLGCHDQGGRSHWCPEMLLNLLYCLRHSPTIKNYSSQITVVPRFSNSDLKMGGQARRMVVALQGCLRVQVPSLILFCYFSRSFPQTQSQSWIIGTIPPFCQGQR